MSAVGIDAKVKAWTPAVPCKIPDNIVSSQFATAKVFVPSYERDKRPCMAQLMTNEYQRIWWQEKESWDKRFAPKVTSKKLLLRSIIRRKPPVPPVDPKRLVKSKKPRKKKQPKKSGDENVKIEETKAEEEAEPLTAKSDPSAKVSVEN